MDPTHNTGMLNITQVERETGLSKDVLRVWERRYGFPAPERTVGGDRLYTREQVERLRLVKRLIDQGHRPGKLLGMSAEALESLAAIPAMERSHRTGDDAMLQPILECVEYNDSKGLRQILSQTLARQGLQTFVQDTVPRMNEMIGNDWATGRVGVHQEHLYTEEVGRLLRTAIGNLPSSQGRPRVLLTTLSGEGHGLGLLMVEGVLVPEGVHCLSLGVQTPMEDIVRAVEVHQIDILALSFSVAFPARQALSALRLLRPRLPVGLEIWAGGAMVQSVRRQQIDGVYWMPALRDCFLRLQDWRKRHSS